MNEDIQQLKNGISTINKLLDIDPSNDAAILNFNGIFSQVFFNQANLKESYMNVLVSSDKSLSYIHSLQILAMASAAQSHAGKCIIMSPYGDIDSFILITNLKEIKVLLENALNEIKKQNENSQANTVNINGSYNSLAVGNQNNISQNINQQYVPEDVLKKFYSSFMENGLAPKDLVAIDPELQSLSKELAPGKQDQSKIKQLLSSLTSKLGSSGKNLIEKSLVSALASTTVSPLITSIIAAIAAL